MRRSELAALTNTNSSPDYSPILRTRRDGPQADLPAAAIELCVGLPLGSGLDTCSLLCRDIFVGCSGFPNGIVVDCTCFGREVDRTVQDGPNRFPVYDRVRAG